MMTRSRSRAAWSLGLMAVVLLAAAGECWAQTQEATFDGEYEAQEFGYAVAIGSQVAIVGVPLDDRSGEDAGAAYVYRRVVGGWALHAVLAPDALRAGDHFGYAVDVSGRRVVVGAPGDDELGNRAGAAYVFEYDQTPREWVQVGDVLRASDAAAEDRFGYRVSMDSPWIAIGAPYHDAQGHDAGAAYVYIAADPVVPGASWIEQKLEVELSAGDEFGCSLDIDSRLLGVGAWKDDERGMDSGAAYAFARMGASTEYSLTGKVLPEPNVPNAFQGFADSLAVSYDGLRMLVGATYDGEQGPAAGAAYIFAYNDTLRSAPPPVGQWVQQGSKLLSTTPNWGDHFGWTVALAGDAALVGAWSDDTNGPQSGAAHAYLWDGTEWNAGPIISADAPAVGARFGHAVALTDGAALIGAPFATNFLGVRSGVIYFYDLPWGAAVQSPRRTTVSGRIASP